MVTKRGKTVRTEAIELPESKIADIEDSYRYLGQMGTMKIALRKLQPPSTCRWTGGS